MAADYFTTDHFKLLNKWKDQRWDKTNPEQRQAYSELTKAYAVTETWARLLKDAQFPDGYIDVIKKPTNQGNNFAKYNWAKIYPTNDAPKELAYTVGINSDQQFVVKIDTVSINDGKTLRENYLSIRGPFSNESPIWSRTTPLSTAKSASVPRRR